MKVWLKVPLDRVAKWKSASQVRNYLKVRSWNQVLSYFPEGLKEATQQQLNALTKKKKGPETSDVNTCNQVEQVKISLSYKAYIFHTGKAIFQTAVN